MVSKRDFLSITDFSPAETVQVIARARQMKAEGWGQPLAGKHIALLFEKPSLRTRVSFEVGIHQLGGFSVYLGQQEVGLGVREPVYDVARVLSGYVDGIVARVFSHQHLVELARHTTVPVINALSDLEHPCQTMADLLTISEHKGALEGLKLAFVGDGNNVARSLCLGAPAVGMSFAIASPAGYSLDADSLLQARQRNDSKSVQIHSMTDPHVAVRGAGVVYTDTWTSMGQEAEAEVRRRDFRGYTVDPALLSQAMPGALFMHDMPVHYGEEAPPGMLDHPQSVAFHQAHNRLHAQRAILEFILGQPTTLRQVRA
ncbi:MAG: ornithine carbamoyltransferase [Dehalococcoidia bacterium]|nr:ornithine carbamoyltransferase [Dehalococcoidia bacterium]